LGKPERLRDRHLVIWPLVPDRQLAPFDAVSPHDVWLLVVLMMAIGEAACVSVHGAYSHRDAMYALEHDVIDAAFVDEAMFDRISGEPTLSVLIRSSRTPPIFCCSMAPPYPIIKHRQRKPYRRQPV